MNKKVGIWIVLILTSVALVIPSVAIVYGLLFSESKNITNSGSVVINPDDVKVSIQTASPIIEEVSTGESQR